ncbi:TetR/AcrR family transcriptional regulator [Aestuariicella hydrocarbonica]|uniref:TetR/AcrR family transcriptional regulator n=1 Tax=Pseudomaricurvus hydrocarbonicus TaxID=1470433 RepID=A0A9E5T4D6_9GAMM|nr:TetR/AcrR family transcriptional regulator [Aestuariicella hydrocarbonica]NHO67907.1 TetR/AcrR family transcriptional regulator [Aestuariicella hydrocarbonica]
MLKERQEKRKNALNPRRQPIQQRARERTQQILDITARLLEEVGVDDLTTILIAKELGISVGSLYHYFPNKHAIMFALGERWLQEMTVAMKDIEAFDIENMSLEVFVEAAVERMLAVYRAQKAVLPLAQALWSIPELRDLDEQHDMLVITKMAGVFARLQLNGNKSELERIGRVYLESTHSVMLTVVSQKTARSKRSLEDLKAMTLALLRLHADS